MPSNQIRVAVQLTVRRKTSFLDDYYGMVLLGLTAFIILSAALLTCLAGNSSPNKRPAVVLPVSTTPPNVTASATATPQALTVAPGAINTVASQNQPVIPALSTNQPAPLPTDTQLPPKPTKGTLHVEVRYADRSPAFNYWLWLYQQKNDIDGNPATGQQLDSFSTENTGTADLELDPEQYVVTLRGFADRDIGGIPFGPDQGPGFGNLNIVAGETTTLLINSGQIVLNLPIGKCQGSNCTKLGELTSGSNSLCATIKGSNVLCGEPDEQGKVVLQLLPGSYALHLTLGAWGYDIGSVSVSEFETTTMTCFIDGSISNGALVSDSSKQPTCQ
jgi:hypothetical protein